MQAKIVNGVMPCPSSQVKAEGYVCEVSVVSGLNGSTWNEGSAPGLLGVLPGSLVQHRGRAREVAPGDPEPGL